MSDQGTYYQATKPLIDEYTRFLEENQLPEVCAEALIHEELTPEQRRWVTDFIGRWESAVDSISHPH